MTGRYLILISLMLKKNCLNLKIFMNEHEVGCDEVVEQEPNVSIPISFVCRLLGQRNIITIVKLAICSGKKPPAARARH